MTSPRGSRPAPPGADRPLGDIVSEVSEKASLLVREEIELAKAEMQIKGARFARGAAAGAAAGLFALFALVYLLHALAWFLGEVLFGEAIWVGYVVVGVLLVLVAAVAGLLARRFIRRAVPPTPQMAIEEARRTRGVLEEVRR